MSHKNPQKKKNLKFSNFSSTTTKVSNNSSLSYASSEDEQNKRLNRLDSTTSYTSGEDEPAANQSSFGYMSQTSNENESISYYNPCEDGNRQFYNPEAAVKRTFSYTSDEGDEALPQKRKKLSESTESPYPSDNETQVEAVRMADNGQPSAQSFDTYSGKIILFHIPSCSIVILFHFS